MEASGGVGSKQVSKRRRLDERAWRELFARGGPSVRTAHAAASSTQQATAMTTPGVTSTWTTSP